MAEKLEDRPKAKDIRPLAALWLFMRPHWRLGALAIVALLASAGLSLAMPLALRRVVDSFTTNAPEQIDVAFFVVFIMAALLALSTAMRFYFVTRLGERVVADLRIAVYDHVIGMSPSFFEKMRTGETLSRLTTDTTLIQTAVGSSFSVALRSMLTLFGGVILLFATSPRLTLVALLSVPLVVAPIILLGRRLRRLSRDSQDRVADASGFAGETLQAAQTVQSFTYEPVARSRFAAMAEQAFETALKRIAVRSVMTAVVIVIGFTAVVGALWLGARDVVSGAMSAGDLAQFVLLAIFVAGSVAALSEVWGELQRAAGATERLLELLAAVDAAPEPAAPRDPAPARGAISFNTVGFSYPSRPSQAALNGVSFEIAPGETVALVGPSGAGKTTVFQLLQRFYDPTDGVIRLDGVDIRDLRSADLRGSMALVAQDPAIFATSAAENIRMGRPGASQSEIEAAARAAAAHDFISALPQGYDTEVGERGVMLSGGQRQRLAIARAILRDAPVLLFDEATSALDAESERLVQSAIEKLSASRTTLIIAHRLATVRRADRILVFEDGRLAAAGRHEELTTENGLYSRLASLQFTA